MIIIDTNEFVKRIKDNLNKIETKNIEYNDSEYWGDYNEQEKRIIYIIKEIKDSNIKDFNYEGIFYRIAHIMEDTDKEYIKIFVEYVEDEILKAKIYDSLWLRYKDFKSSRKALEIYYELIENKKATIDEEYTYLERAFSIVKHTSKKGNENFTRVNNLIKEFLKDNIEDPTNKSFNFLKLLFEDKVNDVNFLISIIENKLSIIQWKSDGILEKEYLDLLEELYVKKLNLTPKKANDNIKIIEIRRMKVNYFLKQIDGVKMKPQQVVYHYMQVVKILKTIKGTEDERIKLRREMGKYQKICMDDMIEFNSKKDVTKEVNQILDYLSDKSFKETLFEFLIGIHFISEEALKKTIEESVKNNPFNLFSKEIVDDVGKVKMRIPGITKDSKKEEVIAKEEYEYRHICEIQSQVVLAPIMNKIKNEFNLDQEAITKIIEGSAFVPEKRRQAFIKGILAGLDYDFLTSLSILIPQVENAVRCLAEECGDLIYNINDEGIEELKSFNAILDLPCLNDCMERTVIFNLKAVFTSKYGLNMRNEIAHGTFDDEEFNSCMAIYTWWFIFKLCAIFSPWIYLKEE